ncbi:ABC transporter permease [Bacillus sp. FJAT-49705]|uniref:ABC transporter permease n=1 Tax=Cytobacillus citreus TaxID=2833586 RepID=A0ABS5NPK2_9BACI|nr:ABC transporter permease [Cytobacillus citreus]MBS4189760.1 ABC transporter permease [Cytobacillus citreus]
MVKLLLFECRKHFLKKSIVTVILLFSVLNVVKIYSVYDQTSLLSKSTGSDWNDLYWEMYEEFGGTITKEKIDKLMSIYGPLDKQTADKTASTAIDNPNTYTGNVYNDTYFFRWNFVNPMEYAYMYRSYANDVVTAAKENLTFFESLGNQYEYKKNAAIADRYIGRVISDFSYTEMYENYIHYDFSAFLVILICMYVLINVFVSEKETEMDVLLLTTKAGGTKTVIAKIMTSAIFVCIVCFWFWLIDFAAFSTIFGSLEATSSPLYVIENFANSSIGISLGEYVVLSDLLKTAGILVLSLVFLLISTLFKNALFPFIISLFTTFGFIYMQELYMGSGHILLKILNPFALVVNRELFRKTEFVSLFGYPVISYVPAFLFAAAWGTLCILSIVILIRKNTVNRKG